MLSVESSQDLLTFEGALQLLAGGEGLAAGGRHQLDPHVAQDLHAGLPVLARPQSAVDLHRVLLGILPADLPPGLDGSPGGPQRERSPGWCQRSSHWSQRGPDGGQS